MRKNSTKKSFNQGFTLIEIMVSLALFAVVALVAVGAFLKIIDANRRAQAIETAVNDTNFALESMVRDLRVGTDYQCLSTGSTLPTSIVSPSITNCILDNTMIVFNSSVMSPDGACHLIHAYQWSSSDNTIQKAEQQSCNTDFYFFSLTSQSSDLTIRSFKIKVDGNPTPPDGSPQVQPKIFILISGTAGISQQDQTAFTVQTTASQRLMQ